MEYVQNILEPIYDAQSTDAVYDLWDVFYCWYTGVIPSDAYPQTSNISRALVGNKVRLN